MEKLRCKCVKGLDGFTWGEVYDVEFAGRVWWAVNDDGKKVSGASESFDPIEEPISDDLEEAANKYIKENYSPWLYKAMFDCFKDGAKWQKNQMIKDAVDGVIADRWADQKLSIDIQPVDTYSYNLYDKVKVIIIKQEGE